MAIVSDIEIRLRADIAQLRNDMRRAQSEVSGSVEKIRKSLLTLAAGFGVAEIVSQIIKAQREFDKLNASLITATGSTKAAGEAMKALQSFAAKTPFSLQEVTEGFLKLRNLGLTPSERALESYGNTSAAMGKSLTQLVEAVADAATGEFERLKEFGIKSKQQGDMVAFTFQGTTTKVKNSAADIEEYLTKIGEVNFAGGMKLQADTLDGAISALGDTWSQTLVAFSQSGFGDAVRSGVMALGESLQDLTAIFKALTVDATEEGNKVDELNGVHFILTTTFEALTVVGLNLAFAFRAVGSNIGAVAAAIANPTQALSILQNRFSDLGQEWDKVNADSEKVLKAAGNARAERAKQESQEQGDRLARYKIISNAEKGLSDEQIKAAKKAAEEAKKLAEKQSEAYKALLITLEDRVASTARELAGLLPLNEAEKAHIDLTRAITSGKLKLTAAQKMRTESLIDEARANEVLAKSNKDFEDLQQQLIKNSVELANERYKLIESAKEEAEQNELAIQTYGMSEAAIIRLTASRLMDQEAQRLGRTLTADEIADLQRVIDLKERSAKAVANKAELEATKAFWGDIEKTAHDTFVSIADGGKGAFQRLKETAKNTFFDWLYQQTLKKWIINIGTSVTGAGVAGAAQAAGGGVSSVSGIASLIGSVKGIGSGALQTAGAVLTGQAGLGSTISAGFSALASGTASGITAGLSSLAGTLGPIALGIAGAAKLLSSAFGRGPKELTGNSKLTGSLTAAGFAGSFQDEWKKKGGWFSSSKTGFDSRAVGNEVSMMLDTTYDAIKTSSAEYARMLGLNADAITNRTQSISIAMGKDEAANQKAIADFFIGVANTVAGELLPEISKFQMAGEEASSTLQRLATNYAGLDQILAVMGSTSQKAFGAVGVASIEARERLIAFAGGLDALASQTTFFNQNFLSQAEQIAIVQKPLNEALANLGYAGITTAEQFKEAVLGLSESGALATAEGAKTYAGLLALAPAFKTVSDYTKDLATNAKQISSDKRQLEIQIMELSGDALGALVANRTLEMSAADASLLPLLARKYALEDEATATTLSNAKRGIEIEIMELSGDAAGALAARRVLETNAVDESLRPLLARKYAIEDEIAVTDAANLLAEKNSGIANTRRQLEIQIMELSGDAAGALTARRQDEIDASDSSLTALYLRIYALQDEALATQASAKALSDNETVLKDSVSKAMETLTRSVNAQKNLVSDAYKDIATSFGNNIESVNDRIQKMSALSELLGSSLVAVQSDYQSVASRSAAKAQVTAAIAIAKASGVLPTPESLAGALSVLAQDSSDQFSSLVDYQRDVAKTNLEISSLAGMAGKELTIAEQQLKYMESAKSLAESAYNNEIGRLDGILTSAQLQVDTLNKVDTSVLSVAGAVALLAVAIQAMQQGATPSNPGGSNLSLEQLYKTVLGRAPDEAGYAFWKKAYGDVIDSTEYADFIKAAQPELEAQERMRKQAEAAAMSGNGRQTYSEVGAAPQDWQQMSEKLDRIANSTEQFASQFNNVSAGGNALITEPA